MKKYNIIDVDDVDILEKNILEKNYNKKNCKESNKIDCKKCTLTNETEVCSKRILEMSKEKIKDRYKLYKRDLEMIELSAEKKKAYLSMYLPATQSVKKELLIKLEDVLDGDYCPYCGIVMPDTIEHILPKDYFSEFSIYSKNLIPCCWKCNLEKGTSIKNFTNQEYEVYNFYEDQIPEEEFLKVEIKENRKNINIEFSIKENAPQLFINHINKLKLLKRYKENSVPIITELKREIQNEKGKIVREDLIETCKKSYSNEKQNYGVNYWKGLLKLEISNSKIAQDYIFGIYKNVEKIKYKYEVSDYLKEIKLHVVAKKFGFKTYSYSKINIPILDKNYELIIEVSEIKECDKILWQVKNEGEEALNDNGIRGQIIKSYLGNKLKESTKYNGNHEIVCYGIKDNKCIAIGKIKVEVNDKGQ
ncbi:MAG: nucleotide-binding domain-containing protein [Cetobacterium sp.]